MYYFLYTLFFLFQILDTRDLKIFNVTDLLSEAKLEYTIGEPLGTFGSCLEIKLPNQNESV